MDSNRPQQSEEIRVLHLNINEHNDAVVYRLQIDWNLQFRLGHTLFGRKIKIFSNHSRNASAEFARNTYFELPWQHDSINNVDDDACYVNIKLVKPGSFHYYFTCSDNFDTPLGSGYFLVDPILPYGTQGDTLPLDCIQCQTFLTKCLGPFDEWEGRLMVAKQSGYNMIHFTPVQELGSSHSSYSLSDQLKLNTNFSTKAKKYTLDDVGRLVKKMQEEWKVLSICDIVLNHTANESPWLLEHPECAYNLENSPHLKPAYLLDSVLHQFAMEISAGKWESSGIPKVVDQEHQLPAVAAALHGFFLPQIKIQEFFMVDIEFLVQEFVNQARDKAVDLHNQDLSDQKLEIIQDPEFRRLKSSVDMKTALAMFNVMRPEAPNENKRLHLCCQSFRSHLEHLNLKAFDVVHEHLSAAVQNVLAGMQYERIQEDGPQIKEVSIKHPLVPRYFTSYGKEKSLSEEEKLMYGSKAPFLMAHNGWVMGDDPLRNFAESDSNVYLRRELIAWGDSVKLRYGEKEEDCPYLWQHMLEYGKITAQNFHGIRLDNCHSTPIHVAEYILDAARSIRPNLYVVAELFTRNENIDNVFVNRLGISSLIRESMSAHDAHEEGRLVYRYGGEPVGAFCRQYLQPLMPSIAHALFMDLTHDNPSPIDKRSVYDLLPSAALVSMACCATGSNRGYDELVPYHVHVVNEKRFYPSWVDEAMPVLNAVNLNSGIIMGKRALNNLHFELGKDGFSEVYVDQIDPDIVAVTRHCPAFHKSVVLVAFTAFSQCHINDGRCVPPLMVPGKVEEIIFEAQLEQRDDIPIYKPDEHYITGLRNYRLKLREHLQLSDSDMVESFDSDKYNNQKIKFTKFLPGSVIAFRVGLEAKVGASIHTIRSCIANFGFRVNSFKKEGVEDLFRDLPNVLKELTLADLNHILFRCDSEERNLGKLGGVYVIPKIDSLPYCGLQGIVTLLADIHLKNDLGNPLCDNLRQGNWLPNYIVNRLKNYTPTQKLALWFEKVFALLDAIPRYLIPCYFDAVVIGTYEILLSHAWKQMSKFIAEGSSFVKLLAMGSIILGGIVPSAPLPDLSSKLPFLAAYKDAGEFKQMYTTLSAGLPHFSTEYTRNWGRDTFIALRGLFLLTGRHLEARIIILGYGGCLRHGLIPNLLDGGRHARFNCRDAIWWWLQSIQEYCQLVDDGHLILKDSVLRLFPSDDAEAYAGCVEQPLEDVIQEALQRHARGIVFKERNAGFNLDQVMTEEGFLNKIGVKPKTGFVYGGNRSNCGTWMDKMGSSDSAGTKGKPATPRDGSAVELVALCKSALRWLIGMNRQGFYPYDSVEVEEQGVVQKLKFETWDRKIKDNFEICYWIPKKGTPTDGYDISNDLINNDGIYKDTYGASRSWEDYQFRCNFPVAMVVAPELFNPQNAWDSLLKVEKDLLGPLGMKTLSENDWAYNGFYDNNNNSGDPKVTAGYNYHQGPEWLWPMGYFLRAKLHFAGLMGEEILKETQSFTKKTLSRHYEALKKSSWRGLPELTNRNGAHCSGSCPVQAWSMGCLLEVLYDLKA